MESLLRNNYYEDRKGISTSLLKDECTMDDESYNSAIEWKGGEEEEEEKEKGREQEEGKEKKKEK